MDVPLASWSEPIAGRCFLRSAKTGPWETLLGMRFRPLHQRRLPGQVRAGRLGAKTGSAAAAVAPLRMLSSRPIQSEVARIITVPRSFPVPGRVGSGCFV